MVIFTKIAAKTTKTTTEINIKNGVKSAKYVQIMRETHKEYKTISLNRKPNGQLFFYPEIQFNATMIIAESKSLF